MTAALARGGDLTAQDLDDRDDALGNYRPTALHKAAINGRTEVVKLLLEQGVDLDIKAGSYGKCGHKWVKTQETTD